MPQTKWNAICYRITYLASKWFSALKENLEIFQNDHCFFPFLIKTIKRWSFVFKVNLLINLKPNVTFFFICFNLNRKIKRKMNEIHKWIQRLKRITIWANLNFGFSLKYWNHTKFSQFSVCEKITFCVSCARLQLNLGYFLHIFLLALSSNFCWCCFFATKNYDL